MKRSALRAGLVVFGDAMLCIVLAMLVQIDHLVNSTLYDYGLAFNDVWAQPYWLMLRISMGLIVAAIFLVSVVELPYPIFEDKDEKEEKPKKPVTQVITEDQVVAEEEEEEGKLVSVESSW